MRTRAALLGVTLSGAFLAMGAPIAFAATTGHTQTIQVRCTETGFSTDANAFAGQKREVTAFYKATGIACRIYDGEDETLLYDPSAI